MPNPKLTASDSFPISVVSNYQCWLRYPVWRQYYYMTKQSDLLSLITWLCHLIVICYMSNLIQCYMTESSVSLSLVAWLSNLIQCCLLHDWVIWFTVFSWMIESSDCHLLHESSDSLSFDALMSRLIQCCLLHDWVIWFIDVYYIIDFS